MVNQYLAILRLIGIYVILIPVILGACLSLISRFNKQLIVNLWGVKAQVLMGGIGVIIHELSHFIVALLFGHHVTKMWLLHLPNPNDPTDNSLGSVDHQWNNHSLYQRIGNVFIGIAPIIGNTLALIFLTYWLMPSLLTWLHLASASGDFSWGRFFLWLVLVTNINIGGFDLSSADLQNSGSGLVTLLLFILVISLIVSLVTTTTAVVGWLRQWLSWVYVALVISIVFDLVTLLILYLISWRE